MEDIKEYSLSRYLLIIILSFVITFTLIYKRFDTDLESNKQLQKSKIDLMYRMIYFQLLVSFQLPEENRKIILDQILQEVSLLTRQYSDVPEIHLQNYILYQHLNSNYEISNQNSIFKEEIYKKYYEFLYQIYHNKKISIDKESLLNYPLKLPLHKILIYDYLKKTDPENSQEYLNQLIQETMPFQMLITILTFFVIISFFIGFSILLKFFSNNPIPFYGGMVNSYNLKTSWILLESAVIYLFLYIPVNYVLAELLKDFIPNFLWFQILYIIFIFILVLIYFKNEVGLNKLKFSLWAKVYTHNDFMNVLNQYSDFKNEIKDNANQNQEDIQNIKQDFRKIIDKMIKEKKIKPLSPIKEIFYGIIAFIVIFPISIIVLLFSIFLNNYQMGLDDAHPLSFFVSEHFFPVLILAVIIAPITEEIVFRNWIYGFFRKRFSIFLSSLISGLIFASFHPQGYVAYPYLIFLGISLAILREYRPGIIAPIITHSCINGLAILMNYLFYKSFVF